VVGHAIDLEDLEARLVVELWVDGWPVRLGRAHQFVAELFEQGVGDGCYGFRFVLDDQTVKTGSLVEARLANTGEPVGEALRLGATTPAAGRAGEARWLGGLRVSGWLGSGESGSAPLVRALVDSDVVGEARADRWTHLSDGAEAAPVRAFDLHLPPELADGRVRRVRIVGDDGRDLPGSPVAVLAFQDGLKSFCEAHADIASEAMRGAIFDQMFAGAHPLRDYRGWAERFPPRAPALSRTPQAAVALLGLADAGPTLASLEAQQGCGWIAAGLDSREATSFLSEDLEILLAEEASNSDFVVFAPAGAEFAPHTLARFAEALDIFPEAKVVYGDLSVKAENGDDWPIAFTAFDYERMLEQGYAAFGCAVRRAHVEAAVAAGVSDIFTLVLSALGDDETNWAGAVVHAPGVAWRAPPLDLDVAANTLRNASHRHLATRKVEASANVMFGGRFPAVHVSRKPAQGRVSVVVTTRDSLDDLEAFLEAFENTTAEVQTELIIADLGSVEDAARKELSGLASDRLQLTRFGGSPQAERAYNGAANIATGDFLLFCDDDMRALRSGWLSEMLSRMAEGGVGAVTPTLLWPTGLVQQCGLALGPDFGASRAFRDLADGDLGYSELMAIAHEVGAASAAGLLTRRADFLTLGGFDMQRFGLTGAAIDYSLRLRAAGYRIVATPYAKLTRSRIDRAPQSGADIGDRARRELEALRYVWGETLDNDPAYSPLLTRSGAPFSALAWPPRDRAPRTATIRAPNAWPAGF